MREEYAPDIIETLENSFGELEHKEDLGEALLSAAKNAVEDNMPDYFSELKTLTEGSFLEELDELNLEVEYRRAVKTALDICCWCAAASIRLITLRMMISEMC